MDSAPPSAVEDGSRGDEPLCNNDGSEPVTENVSVKIPPPPKTKSKWWTNELTNGPRGDFLTDKGGKESYIDEAGVRPQPTRTNKATRIVEPQRVDKQPEGDVLATLEMETPGGSYDTVEEAFAASTGFTFAFIASDCPKTYKQAMNSPESEYWMGACLEEMAKMDTFDVWEIVERDDDMRVLSARWVFNRKIDGDTGAVAAYKARWVAKGFTQIEGIDFHEIFASVAHKDNIRVFLALVNHYRLHCDQVDIKAAFLHGPLKEVIHLEPPEGSNIPKTHVLRLKKSLYGLRQSPRCFNDELDAWLKSEGFQPSNADACLYTHFKGDKFLMLTIHVDDQLIAGNDRGMLDDFKQRLNKRFECVDHGPVKYFLGFNVVRDIEGRKLTISLEHYLETVLEKFGMSDCKSEKTPLPMNFVPMAATDDEVAEAKHEPYPAIVGSLMYAAAVGRPDLAYAANTLARFLTRWSNEHFRAAKHLLRYVRGTTDFCLTFEASGNEQPLEAFVDADWGGCTATTRSTTGYLSNVFGSVVGWRSKRQPTVALSTMEAELMAGCDATKQMKWLRQLLSDLHVPLDGATPIWCDNQGAIAASANPGQHDKRKHMDLRANYVLENVRAGSVVFRYIRTDENPADTLTKSLNRIKSEKCSATMGMQRLHLETRDQRSEADRAATLARGGVL
jgi:hypothetical protein